MSKHDATLAAIFAKPTRGNIDWRDIEAFFVHLGAQITKPGGSIVNVALRGLRATFHSPHPQHEASKGLVKRIRKFLDDTGHRP